MVSGWCGETVIEKLLQLTPVNFCVLLCVGG